MQWRGKPSTITVTVLVVLLARFSHVSQGLTHTSWHDDAMLRRTGVAHVSAS
jgi:hypothetical protein